MSEPAAGVAPAPKEQRMGLPDLTRVAVIFGDRKHDVVLPTAATVIDTAHGLLPLLTDKHEATGAAVPELSGVIVLNNLDGTTLAQEKTLEDAGIREGDMLVLTSQPTPSTLRLITEEISTALAQTAGRRFPSIREEHAIATGSVLLALSSVVMVIVEYFGWRPRVEELGRDGWDFGPTATLAGAALVMFAIAAVATTVWKLRAPTLGSWAGGLIAASGAAFFAVPSTPGAAHILFAAAVAAVCATVFLQLGAPARQVWPTVLVAGIAVVIASAIRLLIGWSIDQIAVAVPLIGLIIVRYSEVIATRLTGIPLAPFPTVTGGLVFDNATKLADAAVVATETDWEPPTPSQLLKIAETSNAWITALLSTATAGAVIATPVILTPGKEHWVLRVIYVALIVLLLILGGRNFGDRRHAIIMVSSAVAMVAAGAIRIAAVDHSVLSSSIVALTMFAVAALGLVATVWVPRHVFTPSVRWWLTVSTWLLTAPLIPLVLWLLGAITFARYH